MGAEDVSFSFGWLQERTMVQRCQMASFVLQMMGKFPAEDAAEECAIVK